MCMRVVYKHRALGACQSSLTHTSQGHASTACAGTTCPVLSSELHLMQRCAPDPPKQTWLKNACPTPCKHAFPGCCTHACLGCCKDTNTCPGCCTLTCPGCCAAHCTQPHLGVVDVLVGTVLHKDEPTQRLAVRALPPLKVCTDGELHPQHGARDGVQRGRHRQAWECGHAARDLGACGEAVGRGHVLKARQLCARSALRAWTLG